jgi:hypothetical protein
MLNMNSGQQMESLSVLHMKRGPRPPCSAPSRRKRQAEEPAEGSMNRASMRCRAFPRGYRASAQAAPVTMHPSPTPRLLWDQVIATPESRAQALADLARIPAGRARTDAFFGMFDLQAQTQGSEAQPLTATAPSSNEGDWSTHDDAWTHGDWSTQDGWFNQDDQDDWSSYGVQSTNPHPRG